MCVLLFLDMSALNAFIHCMSADLGVFFKIDFLFESVKAVK